VNVKEMTDQELIEARKEFDLRDKKQSPRRHNDTIKKCILEVINKTPVRKEQLLAVDRVLRAIQVDGISFDIAVSEHMKKEFPEGLYEELIQHG